MIMMIKEDHSIIFCGEVKDGSDPKIKSSRDGDLASVSLQFRVSKNSIGLF
jgi:hypothetical protein